MSLCLSLSKKDKASCLADVESITEHISTECSISIELRLDLICEQGLGHIHENGLKDVFSLIKRHNMSCILTCRDLKSSPGFSEVRKTLLIDWMSYADFVDVEIEAPNSYITTIREAAKLSGTKLIISYHNYDDTPELSKLTDIVDTCFALGADVAKIATVSSGHKDNANLMSLYSYCLQKQQSKRIIALGMGQHGKVTRIMATYLGSPLTFIASSKESCTAPGQLTLQEMKEIRLHIA